MLVPRKSDDSHKVNGAGAVSDAYGAAIVNESDGKFYGWVMKQDSHIIISSEMTALDVANGTIPRIEAVILETHRFQWADAGGECLSGLLRFKRFEMSNNDGKKGDNNKDD